MAMDAEQFASMLASPDELKGWRKKHRKPALYLCAKCYRTGMSAEELEATVKQEYGSALLFFVLVTVIGAAISWSVERFLSWLYPDKGGWCAADSDRLEVVKQIREQNQ